MNEGNVRSQAAYQDLWFQSGVSRVLQNPLVQSMSQSTQAGVLAVLLLNPKLELSQTELAERLDAPLTSVVDEVHRLERVGILASRSVGRTRLIRAGTSVLSSRSWGWRYSVPGRRATSASRGRSRRTSMCWSWSRTPGVNRDPIYAAADRAGERLGRPVNPTVVTATRWARRGRGADAFLDEVASRPIVTVPMVAEAVS